MMVPYRRGGFRGLRDGSSINPTTMWTPSTGFLATPGDVSTALAPPATYVAPNYVPTPACASGPSMFTSECIAQVLAAQQQNMAANNDANRAVFVADCNRDWAMNAENYQNLGLQVPPNDCAYRGYGQTIPGISPTGSYSGYLPGTPQDIIDWRTANPGGGSPGPVLVSNDPIPYTAPQLGPAVVPGQVAIIPPTQAPPTQAPAVTDRLAATANHYVSAAQDFLTENVPVAGYDIPGWALAAAGLAAFMFLRRH